VSRPGRRRNRWPLKETYRWLTYRDFYMTLFTIAQNGGFHLSAKPAEAMGGEYIPMILSLQ